MPTFHAEFFLQEESQLMVAAQKMLESGGVYIESWQAGPPLMVWIYGLFQAIFGSWALNAIRVFTCFYIYLSAIVFNGILAENKSFRRNAGLISVLFVLLVCTPWFEQQLNASLFVLLPVVLTFSHINQLADRSPANQRHLFIAGVWMMVSMMASYKTSFLLIGVFLAYLVLQPFRWTELMSFGAGLVTVLGLSMFWLFRKGALDEWWDQGILYYADYLGLAGGDMYRMNSWEEVRLLLVCWGGFLVMGLIGFIHYRLNFFKYVRKARAAETIMMIWLIGVMIVLGFKLRRLEMSDFILLVPPLAFYIARTFDFAFVTRFRVPILLLLTSVPIWQYSAYIAMAFPEPLAWISADADDTLRHGAEELNKIKYANLLPEINRLGPEQRIWVMGLAPDLYLRSNRISAVKYTDFRMAYYKLQDLPGHEGRLMFSDIIPARDIFKTFHDDPPAMVLDEKNNFPSLQRRYPGIFGDFVSRKVGSWTLYTAPQQK
ncbi:MAG: hypothetical protein NWR72_02775 [Bacteroidia bacterium]|nr:hypothetical protein [Bacteroidia bacterium]